MPALAVVLNGGALVTVGTDGLDAVEVRVGGDRRGPEVGHVEVSGGAYPEGRESTYLIWQPERALSARDTLSVTLLEHGHSSRAGQTIDQLYPGDASHDTTRPASLGRTVQALMREPLRFAALGFRLVGPDGRVTEGRTTADEFGFGFHVSWIAQRPDRARVSLRTYTLQSLLDHQRGRYHAEAWVHYGQGVTFTVIPEESHIDPSRPGALA
jgi:hypothetical protein